MEHNTPAKPDPNQRAAGELQSPVDDVHRLAKSFSEFSTWPLKENQPPVYYGTGQLASIMLGLRMTLERLRPWLQLNGYAAVVDEISGRVEPIVRWIAVFRDQVDVTVPHTREELVAHPMFRDAWQERSHAANTAEYLERLAPILEERHGTPTGGDSPPTGGSTDGTDGSAQPTKSRQSRELDERQPWSRSRTGRKLIGWKAIHDVLGSKGASRSNKTIRRHQERYGGPIQWVGRKPHVDEGELLGWWDRLEETAERRRGEEKARRDLESHHSRGDQNLHAEQRPNARGKARSEPPSASPDKAGPCGQDPRGTP